MRTRAWPGYFQFMPIIEPAPWRQQYFEHVVCPDNVLIPTDDPEAWSWNPEHRWVFDKLQLALSQGLEAAPHGLSPPRYPVFSKPIFNFAGMGAGSRILIDADDYRRNCTAGHMWMPLLGGEHVSTDAAVVDGRVAWIRHATGHATHDGMFDHWIVHAATMPALAARLTAWVATHLSTYTGMLNIETIGGVMIDAHLRFADQWPDLYGRGWVEALVELYSHKQWRLDDNGRRDGYSVALFMPHGRRYRHPPPALVSQALAMPDVASVQITFHENRPAAAHSMPPGGFRVALVNAWDLQQGRRARNLLQRWFSA